MKKEYFVPLVFSVISVISIVFHFKVEQGELLDLDAYITKYECRSLRNPNIAHELTTKNGGEYYFISHPPCQNRIFDYIVKEQEIVNLAINGNKLLQAKVGRRILIGYDDSELENGRRMSSFLLFGLLGLFLSGVLFYKEINRNLKPRAPIN